MIGSQSIIIADLHCLVNGDERGEPCGGFDLSDPNILEAIQNRDARIWAALDFMAEHRQQIIAVPEVAQNLWNGWDYVRRGPDAAEYTQSLIDIQDNPFASERLKARAWAEWLKIEQARKPKRKGPRTQTVKQELINSRRGSFGNHKAALMLALIDRDGCQCAMCGDDADISIDHIIPLSKGGSDKLDNLQLLCRSCNSSKGDQMP